MIKILHNQSDILIDEWTPYFFVIRDLLFYGKWDEFLGISEENAFIAENILCAKRIEEAFPAIGSALFLPTTPTEIVGFFETAKINLSNLHNQCDLDVLYDLANEALLNDDNDLVEQYAELLIKLDKDSAYGYDLLGTVKYDMGDIEGSIVYLQKAVELDDEMVEPLSTLAQAYFNRKEYEKAVDIWKKMIKLNPDDIISYFTLVDSYLNLKDNASAIRVLKQMIMRYPNHLMGKINLVSLLTANGDLKEAMTYEDEIEKTKPQNPTEMEIWASVNLKKEKYDVVENGIQEYLIKHEGPSFLKLWLVVPMIKSKRIEAARKIIDEFKDSNILFNYGKHEIFDPFLTEQEIWECDLP
ncbi:MAG TPA: tetratricopeptide repeat protein [Thermotogota bacterium]|nr:tetratricopeptide repeat protein [Thermotogota bacterium]